MKLVRKIPKQSEPPITLHPLKFEEAVKLFFAPISDDLKRKIEREKKERKKKLGKVK